MIRVLLLIGIGYNIAKIIQHRQEINEINQEINTLGILTGKEPKPGHFKLIP